MTSILVYEFFKFFFSLKKTFLNILTKIIVNVLMLFSSHELLKFSREKKFTVPPVSTYGDLFLHIHLNLPKINNSNFKILIFSNKLSLAISEVFSSDIFIIYKEPIYSLITHLLDIFKCFNIKKQYEARIYKYFYKYSATPPYDNQIDLINYAQSCGVRPISSKEFSNAFLKYADGKSRFLIMQNFNRSKANTIKSGIKANELSGILGIKGKRYCVMHFKISTFNTDPRGIESLDPFKKLFNKLDELEISPVIVGTPFDYKFGIWDDIPNVYKYYISDLQSPLNDVNLFCNSEFYMGTSSGPSTLAYLTGKPALILDAMPFADWHNVPNNFYYPKPIYSANGDKVTLNELLESPVFYDMSAASYHKQKYILGNLDSESILNAFNDFQAILAGTPTSKTQELYYEFLQKKLSPLHLGLYINPKMLLASYVQRNLVV